MEITKIVGALCASLLLLMLLSWGSETIYHVGGGHGHGDDEGEQLAGYPIEVEVASAEVEEEEAVPFADLMAAADPEKGSKVFSKCKACHKLEDGANGTGPHLYAVVDRGIGDVAGYSYSGVLADNDGIWDVDALNAFLEDPKGYAPGTKMAFRGLNKPEDRANLIAYLQTIN
jgi:cytochrome c